jgi:hypothetical protein
MIMMIVTRTIIIIKYSPGFEPALNPEPATETLGRPENLAPSLMEQRVWLEDRTQTIIGN